MSENMNDTPADDVDDVDDITEEEAAAAENIDLRTLGIEPLTTPVVDLLKIYVENHSTVQEYTKKQKTGKADPSDVGNVIKNRLAEALKSEEAKGTIEDFTLHCESIKSDAFRNNLNLLTASVVLREMEDLVSLLKDEVRYHFDNAVQAEKTKLGIKSTPSEDAITAKLVCVKLRSLIENRVNIAKMMGDDASLPANLFKTAEEGKRGGFNTEVFPKTPRLDMGDAAPTSSTAVAHLEFKWEAKDSTESETIGNLTLRQVAHDVVSQGSYRVTGQEIERMLKKEGHGIGATEQEWSLEFKTGTLYGKKVAG